MKTFLLNLLLTFVWLAVSGEVTPMNLALGFFVGYVALAAAHTPHAETSYFHKGFQAVSFVGFFLWELLRANLRVAHDVVTRRHHMKPAVVALPLSVETDAELVLLACLITLTPGTLSLDFSSDRKTLYVHAMYVQDAAEFRASLKSGFERRVQELLR